MLNKIIKFSLANRLMVIAASALLIVMGTYTSSNMEVDVFPDLTAPTVVVLTEAHGMAPDEVEKLGMEWLLMRLRSWSPFQLKQQ
jgi:Cu/Ag efflux pump CusA